MRKAVHHNRANSQTHHISVTAVIPTKNEGEGLAQIITSVRPFVDEIIVVDGHSQDETKQITQKLGAHYLLDHGLGRGDAVRLGIGAANGEACVLFDADGSHTATDIPRFIKPILERRADVVLGSRRTGGSFDLNMNFAGILRSGGADFLTYLVNRRFATSLSDILYSFRALRTSVGRKMGLTANGFAIEQEVVVKCLKQGYRLLEIPSREKARAWGKSKLQTISGVKLILHLLRELYL